MLRGEPEFIQSNPPVSGICYDDDGVVSEVFMIPFVIVNIILSLMFLR